MKFKARKENPPLRNPILSHKKKKCCTRLLIKPVFYARIPVNAAVAVVTTVLSVTNVHALANQNARVAVQIVHAIMRKTVAAIEIGTNISRVLLIL